MEGLLACLLVMGAIAVYVSVTWIFLRKLKRGVTRWSTNKGLHFLFGFGRKLDVRPVLSDDYKLSFVAGKSDAERTILKQRLAAPNEILSDEDLNFILQLSRIYSIWLVASMFGLFIALAGLFSSRELEALKFCLVSDPLEAVLDAYGRVLNM